MTGVSKIAAALETDFLQAVKSIVPNEIVRSASAQVGLSPGTRIPSNRSTGLWMSRSPASSCRKRELILEKNTFARLSLSGHSTALRSSAARSACPSMIDIWAASGMTIELLRKCTLAYLESTIAERVSWTPCVLASWRSLPGPPQRHRARRARHLGLPVRRSSALVRGPRPPPSLTSAMESSLVAPSPATCAKLANLGLFPSRFLRD